ncbi:hypothetical protein IW140_004100 [Coemansia sp. RSA 1813]|nr:hypothetical protein EV178_004112 [Coemansia sp. RSA 1646]KAJ1772112.1 hypothetical protein LPJ74_001697 [Coemansia sp. RSA 1843]KAJ2088340.1 hypothetical protein IW138_004317 [Coemansia sp. RSA 986]KAJ2213322.1 hypothetical protein EV179_003920 [Coemansia sp. RSA 487]KAJ2568194.1 hypothetical protein IW140_004100 [Coemansia sp. RSA 1813]
MVSAKTAKDYYSILGVSPTATPEEIRTAYMKRAVQVHPDRNPSATATQEFQALADAYYVLSDRDRRSQYDRAQQQEPSFTGERREHADPEDVFGDVFEDMLRPEVGGQSSSSSSWWAMLGMIGGGILGIIIANLPGALVGGFVGRKLGAVRDRTGKPVYDSFKELPHSRKAQVLGALAAQVLGTSLGGNK